MTSAARWERIGGNAATIDALIGRADTGVASVDALLGVDSGGGALDVERRNGARDRAVARQIEDLARMGAIGWADPHLAWGWINRAVALSTPGERARLDGLTYAEQTAATLELWRALGHAYRALDLPPASCPVYASAFARRTIGGDTRRWCEAGTWFEEIRRNVYTGSDGAQCATIHGRLGFSGDGEVVTTYLNPLVPVADYDHWDSRIIPRPFYDWSAVSFHHECMTRRAVSCERYTTHVFPPLRWYFDLAAEVARELRQRGVLRIVAGAYRYVLTKNLATASEIDGSGTSLLQRMGLTSGNIQRVTSELGARDLDSVARAAESARNDALGSFDQYARGVTAVAGVLAVAVPGIGTVVGAVIGLAVGALRLLLTVIPLATAEDRDLWGRTRPVMERGAISGDVEHPPTQEVPAPPGWVRAPAARVDGVGESVETDGDGVRRAPPSPPSPVAPQGDDGVGLGTVAVGAAGVGALVWWLSKGRA